MQSLLGLMRACCAPARGWRWLGLCLIATALWACNLSSEPANLLELREVSPRRLEVGDRLRITGQGFPEGRAAELTLRGELLQSGVDKRAGFTLRETAKLVAPHAVEVPITEALAQKMCGAAPRHTTFRGDLELVFYPESARGSRVSGRLSGVVLDVSPEARHDSARSLEDDARRYAQFLGVSLVTGPAGVRIDAVEPKSRAFRSGVLPGDQVLELAGVVVRTPTDFVPPPNARATELKLWRANETLTLRVDSTGFRYSAPETLSGAAALVLLLFFGFCLVSTRLGRGLAFLENRLALEWRRLSARLTTHQSATAALGLLAQALPEGVGVHLVALAAAATTTALVLGKSIVAAELDLILLPAATCVAFLLTLLITGAGEGRWSLWRGLRATATVLLANLPLLALWLAAGMHVRALRAEDVLTEQGLWPFQWAAFREPTLGLLALACVLGQVPSVRERRPPVKRVVSTTQEHGPTRRQRLVDLAALAHLMSVLGVVSLLVMGGYGTDLDRASLGVRALVVMVALTKLVLLWGLVAAARWTLQNLDWHGLKTRWLTRWVLPCAALLGVRFGTRVLSNHAEYGVLQALSGPVSFSLCVAVMVYLLVRVVVRVKSPTHAGTQPWL